MIVHVAVVAGLLICAVQAVVAQRLLNSALWLAGASALVALEMYLLGAPEVAVIELSVGAGLVTVLFVFAINIAGDEPISALPIVPKPLAWILVAIFVLAFGWLTLDILWMQVPVLQSLYFKTVLWENRLLDVLLQIVLMFAGVLGVLGLLADIHPSTNKTAEPVDGAAAAGTERGGK
jgi:uncharacterized MnhB-related membrane protein